MIAVNDRYFARQQGSRSLHKCSAGQMKQLEYYGLNPAPLARCTHLPALLRPDVGLDLVIFAVSAAVYPSVTLAAQGILGGKVEVRRPGDRASWGLIRLPARLDRIVLLN